MPYHTKLPPASGNGYSSGWTANTGQPLAHVRANTPLLRRLEEGFQPSPPSAWGWSISWTWLSRAILERGRATIVNRLHTAIKGCDYAENVGHRTCQELHPCLAAAICERGVKTSMVARPALAEARG